MKIIPICFIFISIIVFSNAVLKNYAGFKLYKVVPESEDDITILMDIQNSGIGEFWNEYFRPQDDVRIMVAPEQNTIFVNRLEEGRLEATLVFENLQEVINNQNIPARSASNFLSMSWDRYHDLGEINNWLDELVEAYPNIVSSVVMGKSVEDRDIRGIKIDYHPDRPNRKIGFLEGTLHAREWISPATVTWMVKEFLTSSDPAVRALAEDLEWHVFPVVNPDGYVYTFTDNRMWRKNRSRANFTTCPAGNDDMSNGVDLNRNFDFVWMTVGASNDSCTNTFAGPSPASEPETRAIVEYVLNLSSRKQIVYYLSFHSYTQLFIIPYSHVSTSEVLTVNNYADMYEIAIRSAEKVFERFGTSYRVGISAEVLLSMYEVLANGWANVCTAGIRSTLSLGSARTRHGLAHETFNLISEIDQGDAIARSGALRDFIIEVSETFPFLLATLNKLLIEKDFNKTLHGFLGLAFFEDPMSGSSFDWVKYRTDARVSYLIELRDMGTHGFLLPASQIIPNNLEVMDGMIEMDRTTRRLGYYTGASGVIVYSISLVFLGFLTALTF